MGLSGLQKALWDMIMALDFPVCIVSWFFLHQNEISERALLSHTEFLVAFCYWVTKDIDLVCEEPGT